MAAMKTHSRILRSLDFGSDPHRRRIGEYRAGTARLMGAEGASNALMKGFCVLALVLALCATLVHAQTPKCAAPGCDSVTSDENTNTAIGTGALACVTGADGTANTASGYSALASNTTGNKNNAAGVAALYSNTIGNYNEASGQAALYSNTSGSGNEASGHAALYSNTTGSYNVAVGYGAGYDQTTGSNNIYIGHRGMASESGITRIGTPKTQTETYVAGIENAKITGSAVYVTSSGQLGVLASSERYKMGITPIGTTEKLQQLRPVRFHLKSDPKGEVQYGLIAEEVAKVYPELVIRDDKGRIDGVRYDELAPMLLSELQQQKQKLAAQDQRAASQNAKISQLQEQLTEMHAALLKLESKDQLVAQR
jgi:hypothetical protein